MGLEMRRRKTELNQNGSLCVCRQTMVVLLHMHSGFPTKMGEQMIMTS